MHFLHLKFTVTLFRPILFFLVLMPSQLGFETSSPTELHQTVPRLMDHPELGNSNSLPRTIRMTLKTVEVRFLPDSF